jgi:hypothetical protein
VADAVPEPTASRRPALTRGTGEKEKQFAMCNKIFGRRGRTQSFARPRYRLCQRLRGMHVRNLVSRAAEAALVLPEIGNCWGSYSLL